MIVIKAFPRIHVSLLDLGNVTPRRFGGGGFSLDGNTIEVSAEISRHSRIDGFDLIDEPARVEIESALLAFRSLKPSNTTFHICIRRLPPQHAGFGTKTALLLALLAAVNHAATAGLEMPDLQHLSRRGGTSGVGINLFFVGGFICDLGHSNFDKMPFAPSSASVATEVPPVACRLATPSTWNFLLMLPKGKRLAGTAEREFFRQATPLPRIEVLEAIAAMYHGVVPAVLSADIDLLSSSLSTLHSIGFKRRELDMQSEAVRQMYHNLRATPGLAVGLSSLGPLIYAVVDVANSQAIGIAKRICIDEGGMFLGAFEGRNCGYEIAYE